MYQTRRHYILATTNALIVSLLCLILATCIACDDRATMADSLAGLALAAMGLNGLLAAALWTRQRRRYLAWLSSDCPGAALARASLRA
jgi:hypothetical protein